MGQVAVVGATGAVGEEMIEAWAVDSQRNLLKKSRSCVCGYLYILTFHSHSFHFVFFITAWRKPCGCKIIL